MRLHNTLGPVISNCAFYTENVSSFLDYHLQTLAEKVTSYIKDANQFLNIVKKTRKFSAWSDSLSHGSYWSYPNIQHGEGLTSLCKFLETRDNKQISSDTLAEQEK